MNIPSLPQTCGFNLYTPSTGGTIPYGFATMYLTADCTMNVTDHFDHDENNVAFKAGYHPLFFKKIRSVSAGSVYLCHNGVTGSLSQVLSGAGTNFVYH